MLCVDCHSHTRASWDAATGYRRFVADAVAAGLDAVVVTDHHTLEGVQRLRDLEPPFRVIPGVEISTADGELLALFVEESPPAKRPLDWTVAWAHERGAIVVVPHPFGRLAIDRLRGPALARALELVDAIEGVNARNDWARGDVAAHQLAARHGKPLTAGSDAHLPGELGSACLLTPPFADAREFLANLPQALPLVNRRRTLAENLIGLCQIALARAARQARDGRRAAPPR